MRKVKILIVDDHPMMRIAINTAISNQPDMMVVGEAGTVAGGKRLLTELNPDMLLLDLYLPDGNGLQLVKFRNEHFLETKVLVITSSRNENDILAVLEAGAEGIIGKDSPPERLQHAVRKVLRGSHYLMDEATRALMQAIQKRESKEERFGGELSSRELQVMNILSRGATNKEIARELVISESTVRTHLQRILQKLELGNRHELTIYALKHFADPSLDDRS